MHLIDVEVTIGLFQNCNAPFPLAQNPARLHYRGRTIDPLVCLGGISSIGSEPYEGRGGEVSIRPFEIPSLSVEPQYGLSQHSPVTVGSKLLHVRGNASIVRNGMVIGARVAARGKRKGSELAFRILGSNLADPAFWFQSRERSYEGKSGDPGFLIPIQLSVDYPFVSFRITLCRKLNVLIWTKSDQNTDEGQIKPPLNPSQRDYGGRCSSRVLQAANPTLEEYV